MKASERPVKGRRKDERREETRLGTVSSSSNLSFEKVKIYNHSGREKTCSCNHTKKHNALIYRITTNREIKVCSIIESNIKFPPVFRAARQRGLPEPLT